MKWNKSKMMKLWKYLYYFLFKKIWSYYILDNLIKLLTIWRASALASCEQKAAMEAEENEWNNIKNQFLQWKKEEKRKKKLIKNNSL